MKKKWNELCCNGYNIELNLEILNDIVYITFTFCCFKDTESIPILKYPLEDICKDIDFYINKSVEFVIKHQICKRCKFNIINNIDTYDKTKFTILNACLLKCTQGCTFCIKESHRFIDNKFSFVSNKLLEAITKSKSIYRLQPTNSAEPFEDLYIKNKFLFNLHNTNIKYVELLTNAVYLDDINYLIKLKNYFDKYKIDYMFNINFSGFTKEIYESYCTGNFESTRENIKHISEIFGNDKIYITYVISDHNIHLTYDQVTEQFKQCFPFLFLDQIYRSLDFSKFWESEETRKNAYNTHCVKINN